MVKMGKGEWIYLLSGKKEYGNSSLIFKKTYL